MNKIIKALSVCAVIGIMAAASVCLSGCSGCKDDSEGFTVITYCYLNGSHRMVIAYDKKTHVMYVVSSAGAATPMYNADGSLRVYTEG